MFKKLSKREIIESITPYDCYFASALEIEDLNKKLISSPFEVKVEILNNEEKNNLDVNNGDSK